MPGPDASRVVQIAAPQPNNKTELGSGYRVTDAYVLTATHVLGSAANERIAVQSHVGGWRSGVVARLDLGADVSLLELDHTVRTGTPHRMTPPPYGVLDQSPGLMSAVAVGYPRLARKETTADLTVAARPYWDLAEAHGGIAALSDLLQGTFQFDIDTMTRKPGVVVEGGASDQRWIGGDSIPGASPWRGMSGAALSVNNHLIGIITADDTPAGPPRLIATRLDHALAGLDAANGAQARSALGLAPGQRLLNAAFDPTFFLNAQEFRELDSILTGASASVPLGMIYRRATEYRFDPPGTSGDLDVYIGALRGLVERKYLFRFLVLFAVAAGEPETTRQLDDWIERTADRYGVDLADVRAPEDRGSTVLLVELVPDMLGSGWQTKAWTFHGRESSAVATPDEAWNREDLGQWLSTELSKLVDDFNEEYGTTQVTVEFQVNDDALDDDLEWLPVTIFGGQYPVGATCPVVKRSRGRLSQQAWVGNWETKWRRLKECGDSYKGEIIHWIQQPGPFEWEGAHVAAALAYAWEGSDWPQILRALFEAGTPVALWQRTSKVLGRRTALEAILVNASLYKVPERVLAQRIRAARQPDAHDHIGRNLVLLWDDPEHVPDEHQWHAPAYEGVGT